MRWIGSFIQYQAKDNMIYTINVYVQILFGKVWATFSKESIKLGLLNHRISSI